MNRNSYPLFALGVLLIVPLSASAAVVAELEQNGEEVNNSLSTAQAINSGDFALQVPATVFNPPGWATATVQGAGGDSDVDFYSFQSDGGRVMFDIDNDPFSFDTILALFDSSGTLLALDDDSFPEDPGTASAFDSFLGVYTLPTAGTYYIAVSQFSNFPTASFANPDVLFRPDGEFGGTAGSDATVGVSSFSANGPQAGLDYTLYISLENPAGAVPEPATLAIWSGIGLVGLVGATRRRFQKAS